MDDGYSNNRLQNPSALDYTNGWTNNGDIQIMQNGYDDAACFGLHEGGYMLQNIVTTAQPTEIQVGGEYLPDRPAVDKSVKQYIRITLHYADGSTEKTIIPCTGGVQDGV
jgi:hypothetical protein